MAVIKPFAALRPKPELADKICELPYDVMSSEEARQIARDNPLSFLHVSKPEIDLPKGTNLYSDAVYAKGKENFAKLIRQGALRQDSEPCYYLYRQVMGSHSQTGFVGVASCEDYLNAVIKKHEFTRPDKENDRVRHIETLNAQTGPAFLVYRAVPELAQLTARTTKKAPDVDFTGSDCVRHTSWAIRQPEEVRQIENAFAGISALYIADGHHRSAAAARVFQSRKGSGGSGYFLSVLFPHDSIQILPYNRVLNDLNGHSPQELLKRLDGVFVIQESGPAAPSGRHRLGFYLDGKWRQLSFREAFVRTKDPVEKLDVTLLQKFVLDPIFGIDDPRTSQRIQFVGGIRGTAELEKLVNTGQAACAFSMYPTGIDELMAIADQDGIMPPKSTWFEPKLRDGMFSHLL
jgi:uncharacterized protein (DUF1015 family)